VAAVCSRRQLLSPSRATRSGRVWVALPKTGDEQPRNETGEHPTEHHHAGQFGLGCGRRYARAVPLPLAGTRGP
jgi:hypothetical protein